MESVPETMKNFHTLTQLSAWEDFCWKYSYAVTIWTYELPMTFHFTSHKERIWTLWTTGLDHFVKDELNSFCFSHCSQSGGSFAGHSVIWCGLLCRWTCFPVGSWPVMKASIGTSVFSLFDIIEQMSVLCEKQCDYLLTFCCSEWLCVIHSFIWHVQNSTIPFRSQKLLSFLSIMYFFLPPFSADYSSNLSHLVLPSISWPTSQSCCSQIHI